jgi:hypothetical protein
MAQAYQQQPPPGYSPQPAYVHPMHNQQATFDSKPPPYGFSPAPSEDTRAPLLERPKEERFVGAPKWNDIAFLFLFVLAVIAFFVFVGVFWKKSYFAVDQHSNENLDLDIPKVKQLATIAGVSIVGGFVVTFFWLFILKKFAKQMIYIVLSINIVIAVVVAALFFYLGLLWGGIVFLFIALISCLFFYFWRWRIPFAAEMLSTTVTVVDAYPGMIVFASISLVLLVAWAFIWQIGASIAIALNNYGAYVFCVFIFYWVAQVVKNIVHVTCAGTYATWYFLFNTGSMPSNPSIKAFKRATTYSLGSICMGSLIIAILQTIKFMLQQARSNRGGGIGAILAACAVCLLGCIESLVRYFNMYAFTQVAVYGKTYCQAAKSTWELFKSHGIDIIVNDDLIGPVLSMTAFLAGLMLALLGAGWGYAVFGVHEGLSYFIASIVICFFVGFIECAVVMEIVQSGVAAIIVCFAEQPAALRVTKPELYEKFVSTYGPRIGFTSWGPGPGV